MVLLLPDSAWTMEVWVLRDGTRRSDERGQYLHQLRQGESPASVSP